MTRAQFLNDLYRRLAGSGMDAEQAEQHLTYYAEMLADRMEEGMDEAEAVASMEEVETIARRILEEEGLPYRPPVYPDPPGPGGGGKRAYQAPKRMKPAQIALWAVAILCALGAIGRWVFLGIGWRGYSSSAMEPVMSVDRTMETTASAASQAPLVEEYGWDTLPYDYGYTYSGGTTSYSGDSLKKLDIAWAAGMVYVQSWNKDEILIQEYARSELTERNMMAVDCDGAEMTVRYRDGASLGAVKGDKLLMVLVPDGMVDALKIETTSADVWMLGVEQGELDVSTSSGYIDLTECYLRKARLETISGNIDAIGLYADTLFAATTSGYVEGGVYCHDVEVKTISGEVNLSAWESTELVNVSTTSGDVYIGVSITAVEAISVDTTSGYVSLSLPYDMGFSLRYSTVSGDFSSSWVDSSLLQNGKMVYNGGGCEIEVDSVSGSLFIY